MKTIPQIAQMDAIAHGLFGDFPSVVGAVPQDELDRRTRGLRVVDVQIAAVGATAQVLSEMLGPETPSAHRPAIFTTGRRNVRLRAFRVQRQHEL